MLTALESSLSRELAALASRHDREQAEALARLRDRDRGLELCPARAAELWRAQPEKGSIAFPRLLGYGGQVPRERGEGELRPADVFLDQALELLAQFGGGLLSASPLRALAARKHTLSRSEVTVVSDARSEAGTPLRRRKKARSNAA